MVAGTVQAQSILAHTKQVGHAKRRSLGSFMRAVRWGLAFLATHFATGGLDFSLGPSTTKLLLWHGVPHSSRGCRQLALKAVQPAAEGEADDGLSDEELLKMARGPYKLLLEAVKKPELAERLQAVASRAGMSAGMRVSLAIDEASDKDITAIDEATRTAAEDWLREALEEVRGISELIMFRPICDRWTKALEEAQSCGVDKDLVQQLHAEGLELLKAHKERFQPKTIQGNAGGPEYDFLSFR